MAMWNLAEETVYCFHHRIDHVITNHPGADQNSLEVHLIGPLCTVPHMGKARSAGERHRGIRIPDTYLLQLPLCLPKTFINVAFYVSEK